MMQTRNLRTSYFIIWMFPAPSKPFLQTELGLEDFPCAYSTRPDQMRQISPGAGLTLQCSIRRVCDWPQNTLLQGVTLHKQQEDGLLLESLLTAASCFWFCFSLKDTDLSLFADFWIPPSTSGKEGVRGKTKMTIMISPEGAPFQPFFLCQRWQWRWRWNSTSVFSHTSQWRTGQTWKDEKANFCSTYAGVNLSFTPSLSTLNAHQLRQPI